MDIQSEIAQQVLTSAQANNILDDNELVTVPEAIPPLQRMAEQITADLVDYHAHIGKQLQLPVLQRAYCYIFAKGLEASYLWVESKDGTFDLNYRVEDLLLGRVGAQVSPDFQSVVNELIPIAQESFLAVQEWMIANLAKITAIDDGLVLCIQRCLENGGLIGLHRGLREFGH